MEDGWPSGVGLRGQAPNRPELRWLKAVVVSVREKARLIVSGGDQEDVPESLTGAWVLVGCAVKASSNIAMASKPRGWFTLGMSLAGARLVARWCPAQRRRELGLRLLHGT
jgi:hypothetical protein